MSARHGDQLARDIHVRPHRGVFWKPAADGAASTATAETIFLAATRKFRVTSVKYLPSAALTADNTNNAVLTLRRRDADGTNAVSVATITTNIASGNWVQWVAKALVLSGTAANLVLAEGQCLTLEITKGGTGVVVPAGSLEIQYLFDAK